MPRARVPALVLVSVALALGCGSPPPRTASLPSKVAPEDSPPPLDAIYATQAESLSSLAPAWLKPETPSPLDEALQMLGRSINMLAVADGSKQLPSIIALVLSLTSVEIALEQASCDGDCLDLRLRGYQSLHSWHWLAGEGSMDVLLDGALATSGFQLDPEKRIALKAFLQKAFAASFQAWRRAAVERIRLDGTDAGTKLRLLSELASDQSEASEFLRAKRLYEQANELETSPPKRALLLYRLAKTCYRQLDIECGDTRFKEADAAHTAAAPEQERSARDDATDTKTAAVGVIRLRDASGVDKTLERARLQIRLARYSEAKAVLEALRASHPRDVRPVVGLAEIIIHRGFRIGAARKMLLKAQELEHKDLSYYEIVIGGWFEELKSGFASGGQGMNLELLEAKLQELNQALDGYMKLAPDKGRALRYAVRLGGVLLRGQIGNDGNAKQHLRKALDEVIPRVNADLKGKAPTKHMRRLQLMLSRFDRNGARALATVGNKAKFAELEDLHIYMRFALDMVHQTGRDASIADLERHTGFAARDIHSGLIAAKALETGDAALWREVERRVNGLLAETTAGETRVRLLNNLAVTKYHLGNRSEAERLIGEAVGAQEKPSVAHLNALVIGSTSKLSQYESLAVAEISPGDLQARLWAARIANKRRLRPDEIKKLSEADAKKFYSTVSGAEGILLGQSFEMGFGYSTKERLIVNLDMPIVPWFVIPATGK